MDAWIDGQTVGKIEGRERIKKGTGREGRNVVRSMISMRTYRK